MFILMLVPVFFMLLVSWFFMTRFLMIPMLFLVTWNILAVVPVIPNEEYSLAAGIVFAAMLSPMLDIVRRNVKVERWAVHRVTFNDDWLGVDDLRLWKVAYIQLAVKSGLSYADRNANVSGEC